MLSLKRLIITQFKNYSYSDFEFSENIVGISGPNGIGKTNILDAIYYCCLTKSYFSSTEQINIKFNFEGFRLEGNFNLNNNDKTVVCIYRNQKKEISLNGNIYEKVSSHIGLLPAVMITPGDISLINEGSEIRRRFLDALISQINKEYLISLLKYNRLIQQRNSLLKSWNVNADAELLDVIDEQLLKPAEYIFNERALFLKNLIPIIQEVHSQIASGEAIVDIRYSSQLSNENFKDLLRQSRNKDVQLQRTTTGVHKDDLLFYLQEGTFKNIASQGQKKSLLFALKLAEYKYILSQKDACILLLDDVFEKLDEQRIENLMKIVCSGKKGQVFITDTHSERLTKAISSVTKNFQLVELGNISE